MKHIRKKMLRHHQIAESVQGVFENALPIDDLKKLDLDNHFAFLTTDKNEMIGTFNYREGKNRFFIPEPDLVLCLFETARTQCIQAPRYKKALMGALGDLNATLNNSYHFFSTACLGVTSLFNALESFMNRVIPANYEHKIVDKKILKYLINSKSNAGRL